MTHSPAPQDPSSSQPSVNTSFSPFDTFHAPLDGTTSQSIEDQLAAMQQPAAATAMPDVAAPPSASPEAVIEVAPEAETTAEVATESVATENVTTENVTIDDGDSLSAATEDTIAQDLTTESSETDRAGEEPAAAPAIASDAAEVVDDVADHNTPPSAVIAATEPASEIAEASAADGVNAPQASAEEFVRVNTPEPQSLASPTTDAVDDAPAANAAPAPAPEQKPEPAVAAVAEQVEVAAPVAAPSETVEQPVENGFRRLDLRPEIQQAVEQLGYDQPTDVQAQIIPHLLAGRDVLAQSQTGTGKTAAFALPILSLIALPTKLPQVIVLTPTRELAMQVADSFTRYGQHLSGFRVAAVYGGQGYDGQIRQLRRGAPVVVGTPGRVIDLIKRGLLDLSLVGCCVLDEADEMLNMGFLDDVEFVLQQTPEERQVALFSATMPGPIQSIARNYQTDPVRITIKRKTMTAEAIRQRAVVVQHRDKLETLTRLLDVEPTDGVIIFTRTREATVTVAEHLVQEGLSAIALNGDMPQNVRERAIDQLKSGRLDILVATDVAARGLDVSRISHVFNFDVPQDSETYVHRIGRTGRAGRKGEAIILLSNSQRYKLKQIERVTRQSIEVVARPSAADINAARIARFKQKVGTVIEQEDLTFFTELLQEYAAESGQSFEQIAAAMAVMQQNGRPFLAEDRPRREKNMRREERGQDRRERGRSDRFQDRFQDRDRDNRQRSPRPQRRAGRVEAGMERYRIEVGHDDNVKPGNIVGAVANEGGIEGEFIGPINIYDNYSTIDLPEGMPNDVYNVLRQVRVAGKPLQLKKATESDNHGDSSGGRQRRGPRFQGKGKPPRKNRRFEKKPRRHGHG